MSLKDVYTENNILYVELRKDPQKDADSDNEGDYSWEYSAYGPKSDLIEVKITWPEVESVPVPPDAIAGEFVVDRRWQDVYPTASGPFFCNLPAKLCFPPGMIYYRFRMDEVEITNPKLPLDSYGRHSKEVVWPTDSDDSDADSNPDPFDQKRQDVMSCASSADSLAAVDERLEEDWPKIELAWLPDALDRISSLSSKSPAHHLTASSVARARLKDVLREFYSLLCDLYDAYAFAAVVVLDGMTSASNMRPKASLGDLFHICLLGKVVPTYVSVKDILRIFSAFTCRPEAPFFDVRIERPQFIDCLLSLAPLWFPARVMHEAQVAATAKFKPSNSSAHKSSPFADDLSETQSKIDKYVEDAIENACAVDIDRMAFDLIVRAILPAAETINNDPVRQITSTPTIIQALQQLQPGLTSIFTYIARPSRHIDKELLVGLDGWKILASETNKALKDARNAHIALAEAAKAALNPLARLQNGDTTKQTQLIVPCFSETELERMLAPEEADELEASARVMALESRALDALSTERGLLSWELLETVVRLGLRLSPDNDPAGTAERLVNSILMTLERCLVTQNSLSGSGALTAEAIIGIPDMS